VQVTVIDLLRGVQRDLRRQFALMAGDDTFPFPSVGPQLALLREISVHPGVTVNELARLTGLSKSGVSVCISRLAAERVVRKLSDPHDSRLVRLEMTPEGSASVAQRSAVVRQAIGVLLQPLSDEELAAAVQGLSALRRAFGRAESPVAAARSGMGDQPC
jgi:DNA-binding MarR family transcriptional regulator